MNTHRVILGSFLVAVVLLSLLCTGAFAAQARILSATAYTPTNCARIADWDWIRQPGAKARWTFSGPEVNSANQSNLYVLFRGLVTNGVDGGSGYAVTLKLLGGAMPLVTWNPYRPLSPTNSQGVGYEVLGRSSAMSTSVRTKFANGGYVIELAYPNWSPTGHHVAVNRDSFKIGCLK
ncbi:MAG: hypothetical protein ABFE07_01240 [Armatimonadia bacterium]